MEENKDMFTATIGEAETMQKVGRHCKDRETWEKYRAAYEETKKCRPEAVSEYPVQLDIELNGTCNYRCESCTYRLEKGSGKREEISLQQYEEIVTEGVKKGLMAIRLNYHNEPLMKKDICDYIRLAKEKGIVDVYFSSNGSLLDEKMSLALIESGLTRLQISIDAVTEEKYAALRPGGDYNKVVHNIKRFLEIRNEMGQELPTVRVSFVKMESNKDELDEFIQFWKENGVDSIGILDYIDWSGSNENEGTEPIKYHCNYPFNRLVIRYTGDILPCCNFFAPEMVVGNIKEMTIGEAWRSDRMKSLRTLQAQDYGWEKNPVCKKCVRAILKV